IRRHVSVTQELAEWVTADQRFEIVAPHRLNLLCIRRITGGQSEDDTATDQLIERVNATGKALFTRTVLDGRSVLRFSIGGRTTTRDHVLQAWGLLQDLA
ncbi:MAG: hypothetical protein RL119_1301, partial [Actinomycetota bacterium]